MYIEPNSTFWILKDVPLDPTYGHTLYFPNLTAQVNYFKGKQKYRLERQSYQRVKRGYMRVEIRAENLYDCNYIMFQNTGYGAPGILDAKWWFAFITGVEYINNEVSEISFIIDDMQSWYFNYTLGRNFVAREHSATDAIGDNLIPEDVVGGTYIHNLPTYSSCTRIRNNETDWSIVVVTSGSMTSGAAIPVKGTFYGGVGGTVRFVRYPVTNAGLQSLQTQLNTLAIFRNTDIILNIFMCPTNLIQFSDTDNTSTDQSFYNSFGAASMSGGSINSDILNFSPTLGNYTPKNNKLLTYPYTYFTASNQQGTVNEYRYEYFPNGVYSFDYVFDCATDPTLIAFPRGYMMKRDDFEDDVDTAISLTNFPKCPWATSDFVAKLVQGGIGLALGALTGGAKFSSFSQGEIQPQYTPLSVNTPNMPRLTDGENLSTSVMRTSPMFKTTKDEVHSMEFKLNPADAATAAYISRAIYNTSMSNHIPSGNAMYSAKKFGIKYEQVYLDEPFAKIVDDYFTRFGYAVNEIKVPNTHVRENFTYVKTVACSISGSVPADAANNICKIYNNGITFWSNPNNVGDYSVSNRCLADIE